MSDQHLIFSRKISPRFYFHCPVALLMLIIGSFLLWRYSDQFRTLSFWAIIIAYAALAANLFEAAAVEFYFQPRKVLFLTARGVKDLRVASEEIPWRDIEKIREEKAPINAGIVLEMNPAKRAELKLAKGVERFYSRSRAFALNDLLVVTANLRANHEELLATFQSLWTTARALETRATLRP